MREPLSEPVPASTEAALRPRGTTALIAGLVLLGVGVVLWPIGLSGAVSVGAVGIFAVLTAIGFFITGAVLRLAGGAPRPIRLGRTVLLAAGIPLVLAVALGLLEWSTNRGASGMFG